MGGTHDTHSLIRRDGLSTRLHGTSPISLSVWSPSENGLELASCGCARHFFSSAPKDRELPGAAPGAVSPAEAQQRLYHRELSRQLELLPCSAEVLQTSTFLPCPPNDTYLSRQGMASETLKEWRLPAWAAVAARASGNPVRASARGLLFLYLAPNEAHEIYQHFTY